MKPTAVALRPLGVDDLETVDPWFDEGETQRWLGGRDWPRQALRLAAEMPGRFALIVEERGTTVGLIDAELDEDSSVGFALAIAPELRGRGIATDAIAALANWPGLADASRLTAGVERGNIGSEKLMAKAGFEPAGDFDADGFRIFTKDCK